ncbi:hypothetical protein Sjap_021983 [Stephania japonica]|uniref:Uncharacterized protein n=1 Tax=Stephania japonica TaxID=461633 RepID=A0AAP0EN03_9MAGN
MALSTIHVQNRLGSIHEHTRCFLKARRQALMGARSSKKGQKKGKRAKQAAIAIASRNDSQGIQILQETVRPNNVAIRSARFREMRKVQKIAHTMSRKGYARTENEMVFYPIKFAGNLKSTMEKCRNTHLSLISQRFIVMLSFVIARMGRRRQSRPRIVKEQYSRTGNSARHAGERAPLSNECTALSDECASRSGLGTPVKNRSALHPQRSVLHPCYQEFTHWTRHCICWVTEYRSFDEPEQGADPSTSQSKGKEKKIIRQLGRTLA